ncbi:hypothetical protein CBL_11909 [Carabus blaptoides fortunei]
MPSFTIKCCIVGCEATDVHQHRFPNPAIHLDRFNTWLEILGSEDLHAMDPAKLYTNRRICSAHFLPKYRSPGNPRLHRNAVPTLDRTESIILPASPSCTAEFGGQVADTSARRETTPERTPDCHGDLLGSASVTRHMSLTPKAKMLYKTAVHWKRASFQCRRRHANFKTRLGYAEKFAASNDIEKMSVMTPSAQLFFKLQMRETQKSKKLRRSMLDEKTNMSRLPKFNGSKIAPAGVTQQKESEFKAPEQKRATTNLNKAVQAANVPKMAAALKSSMSRRCKSVAEFRRPLIAVKSQPVARATATQSATNVKRNGVPLNAVKPKLIKQRPSKAKPKPAIKSAPYDYKARFGLLKEAHEILKINYSSLEKKIIDQPHENEVSNEQLKLDLEKAQSKIVYLKAKCDRLAIENAELKARLALANENWREQS